MINDEKFERVNTSFICYFAAEINFQFVCVLHA